MNQTMTEAEKSAAYSAQCDNLRLLPWQNPPMCADPDDPRDAAAWALRQKLIDAGLSPYEHDPLAALAKAKAKGQRAPALAY
jgi:hypothetical protein